VIQPPAAALRARELGEAINGHPERVGDALPELAALLAVATDDEVILATVQAISHVWDDRGAKLLLPLARTGHPDREIRQAVAAGLSNGVETEGVRKQVIAALVPMTADPAAGVRNWACFSLGTLDADGDDVREALASRLRDDDADTRAEALNALARTGDPRALEAVLERLSVGDVEAVTLLELRSAGELADPALLPALNVLAANWAQDQDEHTELLEQVLRRCAPDASARAAEFEQWLRAGLEDRLRSSGMTVELEGSYPRTRVRFHLGAKTNRCYPDRLWEFLDNPDSLDLEQQISSYEPSALDIR
jgi:hypothetical protein